MIEPPSDSINHLIKFRHEIFVKLNCGTSPLSVFAWTGIEKALRPA